jgi:hypothetical protein
MVMSKKAMEVVLKEADRAELERWVLAHGTPQQVVLRCRIVLDAASGRQDKVIAEVAGIDPKTAALWRGRFLREGAASLWRVAAGRGRKPTRTAGKVEGIIEATLRDRPEGQTHWSCRTMARAKGISKATVCRIWQAHSLKPHLHKTFRLSRDPKFLEKMTDVAGLYLNPPDKTAVLCVDEKSQIQAPDRTQPGLPLKKGRCGTFTHDYRRNGTATLFAALNMLDGKVTGQCQSRHRHQEWLRFMRRLDREFPAELTLHVIMDNYGTHKSPEVMKWLARHPRFVCHFIPTSSSWLNMVERWFRELTDKAIRRGVFSSAADLIQAIDRFMAGWNRDPKPFVWVAGVDSIMEKLQRCRQTLEKISPGVTKPRSRKQKTTHL